jgi:transcriptional regulator with XRE-family HTH domain
MKTNSDQMEIARVTMGLSVEEIAKHCEITTDHYYKIERGQVARPQRKTIRLLSEIFDASPGKILGVVKWE